jgi:hypothetical protein
MDARRMPDRVNLGKSYASTMAAPMGKRQDHAANAYKDRRDGERTVMGFYLPSWQRGLVWSDAQKIALIESAWRGINIGTYTYNQARLGSPYDGLLIDGQQRMSAIQSYLDDEFPVFGWRWSEVTEIDRRVWQWQTHFASYITETEDEAYLRNYYNLMNFGGVAHKESERA